LPGQAFRDDRILSIGPVVPFTNKSEHSLRLFHRPVIYIQVYPDHFLARAIGENRTIRWDCLSLDNRRCELKDFARIREVLRGIFKELKSGFSLRRSVALMHFIPEHYVPTQRELETLKRTAERAGISFCWMSKWETPHTDRELTDVFRML